MGLQAACFDQGATGVQDNGFGPDPSPWFIDLAGKGARGPRSLDRSVKQSKGAVPARVQGS